MAYPVIVRRHDGVQSYLVLDDNPRELLQHVGFAEQFSVRPWLGSTDPVDALEEWAAMLAEELDNYDIIDSEYRDYSQECSSWDHVPMWPKR
jgi:hypothetical protein